MSKKIVKNSCLYGYKMIHTDKQEEQEKEKYYFGETNQELETRFSQHENLTSAIQKDLYIRNENVIFKRIKLFEYKRHLSDKKKDRRRRKQKETTCMALGYKLDINLLNNNRQVAKAKKMASEHNLSWFKNVLGDTCFYKIMGLILME